MLIRRNVTTFLLMGLIFTSAVYAQSSRKAAQTPVPVLTPADSVYLEGTLVQWHAQSGGRRQSLLSAGPWLIGARTKDKPRDGRLNLYIVAPGAQRHSDEVPQFDHNLVINALPKNEDTAAEWDVYLAVVLDPTLKEDIHTERELILARQQSFTPAEDFKFLGIPGVAFLREFLKFESMADVEGFRRSDGTLPRVVLVPVRAMVKATAARIETDIEQAKSDDKAAPAEPKVEALPAKPETQNGKPEAAPPKAEHTSETSSPPQ